MPRSPAHRTVTTALLFAALGGATSAARADEIILVPDATVKAAGGRLRGQVTTETPAEVKIKPTSGAEQAVPVDQIASITYDGLTPSFTLAQAAENRNDLPAAADLYKKAVDEAKAKPLVARAAAFGRAQALADLALAAPARADEALGELDAFVKANPAGRQVGPALELVVRLALAKGDPARAEAALGELASKVPGSAERTAVLRARVQARRGQGEQAAKALDAIIGAAPKGSARAREAMLTKAEVLAAQKKYDEAEAAARSVIQEAPPEAVEIQAEAHNTLGDCLREAGKPKDALIAYLKTDILYDKDKEQHPRALARIAELWGQLDRADRAAETIERLRQQYPQSPYATAKAAK